jgi:hypothetical protein
MGALNDAFDDIPESAGDSGESSTADIESESVAGEDGADLGDAIDDALTGSESEEGSVAAAPEGEPFPLSDDGSAYMVPKAEWQKIAADKDYAAAAKSAFPTAEDVATAQAAISQYNELQSDFMNGADSDIANILDFFSGAHASDPLTKAHLARSFDKLVSQIPTYLARQNPQGFQKFLADLPDKISAANPAFASDFALQLVKREIASAYDAARASGNPEDWDYAKRLDWGMTGTYKGPEDFPKIDPAKAEIDRISQERQTLEQQRAEMRDADWQRFNDQNFIGEMTRQANQALAEAMAPLKDQYSPEIFNSVCRAAAADLMSSLRADPTWWNAHVQNVKTITDQYRNGWRPGRPVDMSAYVSPAITNFISRAKANLPSIAAKYTGAAPAKRAASGSNAGGKAASATQPRSRQTESVKPVPLTRGQQSGTAAYKRLLDSIV